MGRLHQARLLQFVRDAVALRVHVGTDVMRSLSGCVAEAYPLVERCSTDPGGPALVQSVSPPEAHMVPLTRTAADGLLEGKVLFAAKQKQVAHWRIVVGPV